MTRKLKKSVPSKGTFYDEAYRLIFGAASKKMESEIKKTKHKAEEIELGTKETEESIARGARRTKHRFRI